MARIRSIKPEFFLHEGLADLSPLHRLFFVGLWTLADKAGRLEDRPKRIKAALLPWETCDVDSLLWDLADGRFIIRYEAGGKDCIAIPAFEKHQRAHPKETPSGLPEPTSREKVRPSRVISRQEINDAPAFPSGTAGKEYLSLESGKESLDTPEPVKTTDDPIAAMSGLRAPVAAKAVGGKGLSLRDRLEAAHVAVRKSAYDWRIPTDDNLLRELLPRAGNNWDELERVWRKALGTQFPLCLNLSSLRLHWGVYAGVDPLKRGGRATEAEKYSADGPRVEEAPF